MIKDLVKGVGIILLLVAISYGAGWVKVHQTSTVGKAQKNAEREVYEESKSYVFAKRQEAVKLFREYNSATDTEEEQEILAIVRLSFTVGDIEHLDEPVKGFVSDALLK